MVPPATRPLSEMPMRSYCTSRFGALTTKLPDDCWLELTAAEAYLEVATEAASAFFCWLLLPEVTFTPMLPVASANAASPTLAVLVLPMFLVTLA